MDYLYSSDIIICPLCGKMFNSKGKKIKRLKKYIRFLKKDIAKGFGTKKRILFGKNDKKEI